MSGAEVEQTSQAIEPERELKLEPLARAEKLASEIERFSGISTELTKLLSRWSREAKSSAEQLGRLVAAVDLKKKELNILNGIQESSAVLERLVQDHRQQKESFERHMEIQRAQWEEEKARRVQEEKQYQEGLQLRRQHDEDEYKQMWAAEKLKAQQKLEEELRVIQQESLQKQQALERDCLERELKLREKELEWVQLIQELEQFMSKLSRHTQAVVKENAAVPGLQEEQPQISSLKEMLVSQGQRIENLNSEK